MDIYNYLKADHRYVAELLEKTVAARSDARRQELLAEIEAELTLHAKTEEATFYATLKNRKGEEPFLGELMPEAQEEHDDIEKHFAELSKLKVGSSKWLITFGSLKHCIEHHVEEEEGMIFDHAKKVLSRAEATELAEKMKALKEEMKGELEPKQPKRAA